MAKRKKSKGEKVAKEDRVRVRLLYVGVTSLKDGDNRKKRHRYALLQPHTGTSYAQGHECPWDGADSLAWLPGTDMRLWDKKMIAYDEPGTVVEIDAKILPEVGGGLTIWRGTAEVIETLPNELRVLLRVESQHSVKMHEGWLEAKRRVNIDDHEINRALDTLAEVMGGLHSFNAKSSFADWVKNQIWHRAKK